MTLSRTLATMLVNKGLSVSDLVEVLGKYKLLSLLPEIKRSAALLYNQAKLSDTIMIESPFPLNEEAVSRIKRIVGNDLAVHSEIYNRDLLSGFKARFRGKLYDGSAERIIRQLRSE